MKLKLTQLLESINTKLIEISTSIHPLILKENKLNVSEQQFTFNDPEWGGDLDLNVTISWPEWTGGWN